MKDDLPELPANPPRKQRHLEMVPDVWLRLWLERDLRRGDLRRVEKEIDRRRALRDVTPRPVGVIVGPEGVTPEQLVKMPAVLAGATEIHHAGVPSRVHTACRSLNVPVVVHRDQLREVVKVSEEVVAFPNAPETRAYSAGGVWEWIGYAKHRRTPVQVVMPNGTVR